MIFKRFRKIKAPEKRSADERPFQVYEIVPDEEKRRYKKEHFVSPIFGTHVKDEVVIPIMTNRQQNLDTLDSFRTRPKLTPEERKKRYGSEYPEFDLVRGKNLNEVLENQGKPHKIVKTSIVDEEAKPHDDDRHHYNDVATDEQTRVVASEEYYGQQETDIKDDETETIKELEKTQEEALNEEQPLPVSGFVKSNKSHSKGYQLPSLNLLKKPSYQVPDLRASIEKQIDILNKTFEEFQVGAKVIKHTQGPTVTRYEVALDSGVNVRKVTGIADNLKMALAATQIRIEAPIPGKSTVGIEVPNEIVQIVHFVDIVKTSQFQQAAQPLTVGLGLDIDGNPIYTSIKYMPHGLVAGATGSGKSVCINTILMSLLLKYTPSELKLILIDPKMVELSSYQDIPHLLTPVITDVKAATAALRFLVDEMEKRFNTFSDLRVRDIEAYNEKIDDDAFMPYIVLVIDELADLMMISSQHVEDAIKRLTQKARACGIHLIIATQRPSTDVIKGTIKSNIPTRIAFSVSSHVDSQTIIDSSGADKLLGRGDMLFVSNGQNKVRLQGAFISDQDIETVTEYLRGQMEPNYLFDEETLVKNIAKSLERDEYFEDIARFVVDNNECSINKISKAFSIGFNRAQSIVENLEEIGVVSENLGSRSREVLVDETQLEEILNAL